MSAFLKNKLIILSITVLFNKKGVVFYHTFFVFHYSFPPTQKQLAKMREQMSKENSDDSDGESSTGSAPSGTPTNSGASTSGSGDINIDDIV